MISTDRIVETGAATELPAVPAPALDMQAGLQPLDALMLARGWNNHELVAHSAEHLTHKVVQKARAGRRLTKRAQEKILRAVNHAATHGYRLEELFNYRGR